MGEPTYSNDSKGLIPNFFYDVISFILPGGWLVLGAFWIWNRHQESPISLSTITESLPQSAMSSVGVTTILLTLIAVLSFGAASLTGFLIAAFAHATVEQFWNCKSDWLKARFNLDRLKKFTGLGGTGFEKLNTYLRNQFGLELEIGNLEYASFLCSYHIWHRNPTLGKMTTRIDAERLAGQSFVLVSLILFFENLGFALFDLSKNHHFHQSDIGLAIGLLFCIVASGLSFNYHRKKRLYGRFQIYLAMVSEVENSTDIKAATPTAS